MSRHLDPDEVEPILADLAPEFARLEPEIRAWAEHYAAGHLQHYRDIIARVARIAASGNVRRVLDVGAVPGHVTAMLTIVGLDVEAVDLAPERAAGVFEELGVPTHAVDLDATDLPMADGAFDLVLFCEVMEHLRMQPVRALKQVHRVLRRGGHLLLSVPNITPLMRWRFLLGEDYQGDLLEEFNKLFTIGHMGHFRLYSRDEVVRILRHIGFHVVEISVGGKMVSDGRWDARILRRLVPKRMRNQLYVWARK